MNIAKLKQTLGAFFFALVASFFVNALHTQPASAAGETYTWKDYRTIVVSGGDIRNNDTQWNFNEIYLAVDEGQPGLSGDQIGIFRGSLLLNKGSNSKCYFGLEIYVYKGNVQGMVWSPPPYGKGQSAVPAGYPGDCESFDDLHGFLESSYHNQYNHHDNHNKRCESKEAKQPTNCRAAGQEDRDKCGTAKYKDALDGAGASAFV